MAQNLTAKYGNGLEVAETFNTGLATSIADATLIPSIQYVSGNAAVALGINAGFMKAVNSVTLNSSASVTYTLTALTDDAVRTITLAGGVRFILLTVTFRNAGDFLTVGNAATAQWSSPFTLANSALKVFDLMILGVGSTDKYAVANGSNEQLKITNSGNAAITFKLALLGCAT